MKIKGIVSFEVEGDSEVELISKLNNIVALLGDHHTHRFTAVDVLKTEGTVSEEPR